jgi:hypothetical protein
VRRRTRPVCPRLLQRRPPQPWTRRGRRSRTYHSRGDADHVMMPSAAEVKFGSNDGRRSRSGRHGRVRSRARISGLFPWFRVRHSDQGHLMEEHFRVFGAVDGVQFEAG